MDTAEELNTAGPDDQQTNNGEAELNEGEAELNDGEVELNDGEAGLNDDSKDNHLPGVTNGVLERETEVDIGGDRGGGGEPTAEGGDLSSINAMMSAVMSAAGTINGEGAGVDSTHNPPAGPLPSPSPKTMATPTRTPTASRNARHSQETKDENAFICPLCDKNCMTQHQLTMHIRQHNADTGATDHSCSICGKALSSASSLDRHMLVHSGERPYKCSICAQTFTTNGNMHRHMKIHEKDQTGGAAPLSPPSPTKRRRPSVKRRPGPEEESREEPPAKKVLEDGLMEEVCVSGRRLGEEELLCCPICFRTCCSRSELDLHMDLHPDTTLRCDMCCVSFRTHRGLLRHNAAVHKLLPLDPSGSPFIQNNPSIPTGFNDLAFIDFSCKKFPHIAQVWCETNLRRCVSKFHRFVCDGCDKAFPLRSALELHRSAIHPDDLAALPSLTTGAAVEKANEKKEAVENDIESSAQEVTPPEQASFLESLGLLHVSKVETGPTDDEIHQAHLDSIRVIHAEPPSSTFPQEPASACLGVGLGVGLGALGLGIPLLEAAASGSGLQGLGQREALSLLSLQPFPASFLLQADGGAMAASAGSSGLKPGEAVGAGLMELADIKQILKVAAAVPNQMGLTLPPLAKAPGYAGGQGLVPSQKAMPPLKPKPPTTPRSSLTASTPPPLQSSQQASLGCISPSLPPPNPSLFKTPSSSSSSSSSGGQLEMDYPGDAHTPSSDSPPAATTAIQEEAGLSSKKPGSKAGSGGAVKGHFPCRFCNQVFAYAGVLQSHMRFHLGILPHQCNICDYVAPDKATLIRHLRTHSGERPYVCRVCHYPFTVKANCERHLRKKHAKTSRKEIEKNIKYVTSSAPSTQDASELAPGTDTACRYCGEDLKSYRALQIHLRTHNGCQRKPFECRRCGAAFLAKRNCIHHLLKQHPEVQEREIEDHIGTLLPPAPGPRPTAPETAAAAAPALNGVGPAPGHTLVKAEELVPGVALNFAVTSELDQPLDFSSKGRGGPAGSPGIKLEALSPGYDCGPLDQPIDLSVPSKRQRREIKAEPGAPELVPKALGLEERPVASLTPLHPHPQPGCYQLPPGSSLHPSNRSQRLKPLLPKPSATSTTSTSSLKDLPPLASIAQIIHSVSGAPELLKREASSLDAKPESGPPSAQGDPSADTTAHGEPPSEDTTEGAARKRSRKKASPLLTKGAGLAAVASQALGAGIDLESSGEFASVEKMLATTDANKFSPYLQTGSGEMTSRTEAERRGAVVEEKEGGQEAKPVQPPQSKGKKNAYSNSVQKMTCPFCPRVFPWASSLQRHMLTHTGQKPFPCPKCDAFFSTKSNCERHLLRKHGVTNRTLRRNGGLTRKEGEEGSHESAESQSETEQAGSEAVDLSGPAPESGSAPDRLGPSDPPRTAPVGRPSRPSPAPRPQPGGSPAPGTAEQPVTEQPGQQVAAPEAPPPNTNIKTSNTKGEDDDEDAHSNKSLDLDFASKLIDFKFSADSASSSRDGPHSASTQPAPPTPPSNPSAGTEASGDQKERSPNTTSSSSSQASCTPPPPRPQPEYKHVCRICRKSFRYATTLARHERAHLSEDTPIPAPEEAGPAAEEEQEAEPEMGEEEEEERAAPKGDSEGADSDSEGEEKEKEERSDSEGGGAEPKSEDGGAKTDKRKKICSVCSKRFWSLQDLTRHMRSHTGERPYQCPTCERTFTLKHSLVRHQRIHLKPRGAEGGEDADSACCTPTSTCPTSENESEGGGAAGAKEEEEAEEEEEEEEEVSVSEKVEKVSEPKEQTGPSEALPDPPADTATSEPIASQPATKDPAPNPGPTPSTAAASNQDPAEGFIQGVLEIHTKPSLDHVLPNGEPPLLGLD